LLNPHPSSSLGARTSATFGIFRCLRSEPASHFWAKQEKKQNLFANFSLGKFCLLVKEQPVDFWRQKPNFG